MAPKPKARKARVQDSAVPASNWNANQSVYIHGLPAELLIPIFQLVLDEADVEVHYSVVCRLAQLPIRSLGSYSGEVQKLAVEALLVSDSMIRNNQFLDAELFGLAVKHLGRWSSLHLETTPLDVVLNQIWDLEAPHLTSVVWGWNPGAKHVPGSYRWYNLQTPQLRTLFARTSHIDWEKLGPESFSRLEEIDLEGYGLSFPRSVHFRSALAATHFLRKITIKYSPDDPMYFDQTEDFRPISLPHLTDLLMLDAGHPWLFCTLQKLEIPDTCRVVIESDNGLEAAVLDTWWHHRLGLRLWPVALRLLPRPQKIVLDLSGSGLIPHAIEIADGNDGSGSIERRVLLGWPDMEMRKVGSIWVSRIVRILENAWDLEGRQWDINVAARLQMFEGRDPHLMQLERLPRLDEIILKADDEGIQVAKWLSTCDGTQWPLPGLRRLTIHATAEAPRALRLLRTLLKRFKYGCKGSSGSAAPLERLHVIVDSTTPPLSQHITKELEAAPSTGVLLVE